MQAARDINRIIHCGWDTFSRIDQGTQEWLDLKSDVNYAGCFSGSELGAALGLDTMCTRSALIQKKTKPDLVITPNKFGQRMMNYGKAMEPVVFQYLRHRYTGENKLWKEIRNCGTYCFKLEGKMPIFSTPDAIVVLHDDTEVPLEIKCPARQNIYDGLQDGVITLKDSHYLQVQAEIHSTQATHGLYVCWEPRRIVIVEVLKDTECMRWAIDIISDLHAASVVKGENVPDFRRGEKKERQTRMYDYMTNGKIKLIVYKFEPTGLEEDEY